MALSIGIRPPVTPAITRFITEPGPQTVDMYFSEFFRIEDADLADLDNLQVIFAPGAGASFQVDRILSIVPEPATLCLLAVGAGTVALGRRDCGRQGGRRRRVARFRRLKPIGPANFRRT